MKLQQGVEGKSPCGTALKSTLALASKKHDGVVAAKEEPSEGAPDAKRKCDEDPHGQRQPPPKAHAMESKSLQDPGSANGSPGYNQHTDEDKVEQPGAKEQPSSAKQESKGGGGQSHPALDGGKLSTRPAQ